MPERAVMGAKRIIAVAALAVALFSWLEERPRTTQSNPQCKGKLCIHAQTTSAIHAAISAGIAFMEDTGSQ